MNKRINFKRFAMQNLVLLGILVLCIVTVFVEPAFLSKANMNNILRQFGSLSFVALGMTYVIIGGFIDLSVVGIVSLVGVVTLSLVDPLGQVGALICGLVLGVFLGLLNGCVLVGFGAMTQAEVLFITYGMSSIYGAAALIYTGSETAHLSRCANPTDIFTFIGTGKIGPIPFTAVLFVICLIVLHLFHRKTIWGRQISLMGGNKAAATLCGYNMKKTMILTYAICGLMTSIGSIALLSRVTTASPTSGAGYETNAIMSVVVGGTALAGGSGSGLRTVLGVFLIIILSNCMNMLGLSTYMQTIMKGLVLVVAIWLDNRKGQTNT